MNEPVALITGGAGGIGSAIARRLAARGARVVIADRNEHAGTELAAELDGIFVRTDVGLPAANAHAVATAVAEFGGLDMAVLNAAVPGRCGLDDFDPAGSRELMRVNLDGVVHGLTSCLKPLRASAGSALIVSSIAGLVGSADVFYATAKHALIGLVRSAALTQRPLGVKVNALCPGVTDTPALAPARRALRTAGLALASPQEVPLAAETVLTGEHGGPVEGTGQVWTVQAGRPVQRVPPPPWDLAR